jgi:predicted permease
LPTSAHIGRCPLDSLWQDLRYAARQLLRAPGFTLVAIVTLALGIGANSALFTLAVAILDRPLPGVHSNGLVWLTASDSKTGGVVNLSYPDYLDYRAEHDVFADVAAFAPTRFAFAAGGNAERVRGAVVTSNYFALLGAPMAAGRGFLSSAGQSTTSEPAAIISYDLWQRRFDGEATALGTRIVVNGASLTIVGVAGQRFNGAEHSERLDLWVPVDQIDRLQPQWPHPLTNRGFWWLRSIGRLAPGVTELRASATAATVARRIASTEAEHKDVTARVEAVRNGLPPGEGQDIYPVAMLGALVTGLVLLIACANVSNLLLARAVARRREIAIRRSIGAGRGRVVRQLLTESTLLALLAMAGGLLLASWITDVLAAQLPVPLDITVDRTVLVFSTAVALLTGVLFGLAPAVHATRGDLTSALRAGLTGFDRSRARLQGGFVIAQLSLSLVLLATAGIFLSSLLKMGRVDVGFDATTRVLALSFDLSLQGYTPERASSFVDALGARAGSLPGVQSVSFTNLPPLAGRTIGADVAIQANGVTDSTRIGEAAGVEVTWSTVRPGYFSTVGIPLLAGRDFNDRDGRGAPPVAIVSEQVANRAWPRESPLGKRISFTGPRGPFLTVVGVARDAVTASNPREQRPQVYAAQLQRPATMDLTLLVRANAAPNRTADATVLAAALRRELAALDRNLPIFAVQTLAQYRHESAAEARLGSGILAAFGSLALVLASIGVYGVISFSVRQRSREIGLRVALGAREQQVVRLFLGEGLRLTGVGIVIGLLLALGVVRLLSALFLGVAALDALAILGVLGILTTVALLSCWVPARRAARVDPMHVLRLE